MNSLSTKTIPNDQAHFLWSLNNVAIGAEEDCPQDGFLNLGSWSEMSNLSSFL